MNEDILLKKYILYATDRVGGDFRYIFDNVLEIVTEISDISQLVWDGQYPVILSGFDKSEAENYLVSIGKERGKDYYLDEDFFGLLDDFSIPSDRRLAVWGTGRMADFLMTEDRELLPECYIDSNRKQAVFNNKPVYLPDEIKDWREYYIIVAVAEDGEIRDRLEGLNLKEKEDYISFRDYLNRPSALLKKTIFDRNSYDLDCRTMLNHLEILWDGGTSCCCTTFMDERLGSVQEHSRDEIWNSVYHQILCLSAINRTYTFCKKDMCPLFIGKNKSEKAIERREYPRMPGTPRTLVLAYDDTCNLYCDTCREQMFVPDKMYREQMSRTTETVLKDYLPEAEFMVLAGAGEVFASPSYREIFTSQECRNIKYIRLLSNGMLFNEKNWESLVAGKHAKIMLTVSVDAASKETYESIRRGGNFDVLKKNMEYAAALRRSGELSYFRMNFVVQRKNYREMPDFVRWGEELGCDEVFFTKILNWGTYSEEEFSGVSMMENDGVTPKPELLSVMNDPAMQSPIVDMGTIQALHKVDETDIVQNYYMWELEKRGGKLFKS